LNDSPGNPPEFTSLYFTKPTKRKNIIIRKSHSFPSTTQFCLLMTKNK
jgi:hypothetical protein